MVLPELTELDGWLAAREAQVPGLKAGCEKRIDWPDASRDLAPLAVLYVHGFSASGREVSPVPERVAQALGAPLHVTRLTGHGQDGAALAAATKAEWQADVAEALAVAGALGARVLIIACSTGATLVTEALAEGVRCDVAGVVFISPNFGMRHWALRALLNAPGSRTWGPWVTPKEMTFPPKSPEHDTFWTLRYPPCAVFAADDAVKAARAANVGRITAPSFWAICDEDKVVHPAQSAKIMARWGGAVTRCAMVMGPDDDPMGHLVVGEIHSAGQVEPFLGDLLAWLHEVGVGPSGGSDDQKKQGPVA